MESLKEFILPKTFNRFSYVANVFWILLGVALSGIFLDIEINESRRDFVCGSSDDSKELIRGKCWEQYKKQINKFGIPMYGFVIVNFSLTALVLIIYSQAVKSRVEELERLPQQQNPGGLNSRKKLFITVANLLSDYSWGSFLSSCSSCYFILADFPRLSTVRYLDRATLQRCAM